MIDVCLNSILIYSFTHVDSEDACMEEENRFDKEEAKKKIPFQANSEVKITRVHLSIKDFILFERVMLVEIEGRKKDRGEDDESKVSITQS